MTAFRGGRWPNERQMLLLRAATEEPAAAEDAWAAWISSGTLDDIDVASYAVLPQVYENLRTRGSTINEMARLQGIHRRQWYHNRMAMHSAAHAGTVLGQAGIEAMLLKGAALLTSVPGVCPARAMNDVDILVHPDRVEEAARALIEAGWKLGFGDAAHLERLVVLHALELRERGMGIDLHRRMLEDNAATGIDESAWRRAASMTLESATFRVPPIEELLVSVCVHGLRATPTRNVRWVLDALAILAAFGSTIEWEQVDRIARRRRVSLAMGDGLQFLSEEFGASVPATTLLDLRKARRDWLERFDYRAQGKKKSLGWAIASTATRYLRQSQGQPVGTSIRQFPRFLQLLWRVERSRDIPREGLRRVRQHRAHRHPLSRG